METVSIVMPAYNEEKRISNTLKNYSNFFHRLSNAGKIDYEILVIINNTSDRTEDIVKYYSRIDSKIKYKNFKKGGKGFAVIEGFKEALKGNSNFIGFVDADMATPPEEYWRLILKLRYCDAAIASRYIGNAKVEPKQTIQRVIASRIFNGLIRVLLFFPYRDTQCGAKLFKREVIENILPVLSMSKWAFDVDLIYSARKKGFIVKEMPTYWRDRNYSKINFLQAGPWMALGVARLRIINSPFRNFIRIYDRLLNKLWKMK